MEALGKLGCNRTFAMKHLDDVDVGLVVASAATSIGDEAHTPNCSDTTTITTTVASTITKTAGGATTTTTTATTVTGAGSAGDGGRRTVIDGAFHSSLVRIGLSTSASALRPVGQCHKILQTDLYVQR